MKSMICTCIIPFYNEGMRIIDVLQKASSIEELDEIICIDDGSTDDAIDRIAFLFPQVKVIRNRSNTGKTEAVNKALKYAKGMHILLLDADLKNLKAHEVRSAILQVRNSSEIDMVVLRRINAPLLTKIVRGDILVSGERILKKTDMEHVLSTQKPQHFQLEFAINRWMMLHRKNVYWMPSSASNTYKMEKQGFVKGLSRDILSTLDIVAYLGLREYVKQVLFFCKQRA